MTNTIEVSKLLEDCDDYLKYLAQGCEEKNFTVVFQPKDSAVFRSWITAIRSIVIPSPGAPDENQ